MIKEHTLDSKQPFCHLERARSKALQNVDSIWAPNFSKNVFSEATSSPNFHLVTQNNMSTPFGD